MATTSFQYDPGFKRLLEYAAYDCAERGERAVRVDHLALALYREDFPLVDEVLAAFRVDSINVLERLLKANPGVAAPVDVTAVELSPEAMRAIALGEREAQHRGDKALTAAHVFVGVLRSEQKKLRDFFVRDELVGRGEGLLADVVELVRWLRSGAGGPGGRELDVLEDGTLVAVDAVPWREAEAGGRSGLAVKLKILKYFS